MRSQSNSPVVTFFMLAPLLAIPLLAVFGVPKFQTSKTVSATAENDLELGTATGETQPVEPDIDKLFEPIDTNSLYSQENSAPNINRIKTVPAVHNPDGLQGWSVEGSPDKMAQREAGTSSRRDIGERFEYVKERSGMDHSGHSHGKMRSNEFLALAKSGKDNQLKTVSAQNPFSEFDSPSSDEQPLLEKQGMQNNHTPALPQNWKEAVGRLNDLGIRDFSLQPGVNSNEFYFSCSYTPENNPRITHRFESEATEPLKAVQQAILQVEEWRQSR